MAQYILDKMGSITTIKLQKLVYYCQAWSLVWDDISLFDEEIQAWAHGPVVPDLYNCFRGDYYTDINRNIGTPDLLDENQKETIDAVIRDYGNKDTHWLVELTHLENPWKYARERANVRPGEKSKEIITNEEMFEYYSNI